MNKITETLINNEAPRRSLWISREHHSPNVQNVRRLFRVDGVLTLDGLPAARGYWVDFDHKIVTIRISDDELAQLARDVAQHINEREQPSSLGRDLSPLERERLLNPPAPPAKLRAGVLGLKPRPLGDEALRKIREDFDRIGDSDDERYGAVTTDETGP